MICYYDAYFMGSIVLAGRVNAIIDGQQRFSTLTLLLIYLNNRLKKLGVENRKLREKLDKEEGNKDTTPYYQRIFDQTKQLFAQDHLFDDNAKIEIRENSFEQIVKDLEIYNLSTTSDDVKGIAFEKFLGKTFRGELGQFFTPRPVVDFMVNMVNINLKTKVLDPACGTGGFLIKAF